MRWLSKGTRGVYELTVRGFIHRTHMEKGENRLPCVGQGTYTHTRSALIVLSLTEKTNKNQNHLSPRSEKRKQTETSDLTEGGHVTGAGDVDEKVFE